MSLYHKIWIEVDVRKEQEKKTKKILEIIKALENVACIENVSKVQYIPVGDKPEE